RISTGFELLTLNELFFGINYAVFIACVNSPSACL
ncbi:hypothetical protein CDAR_219171, partial [Caerostris darwini]